MASERLRKGSNAAFFRSPEVDEEMMRSGHWLMVCVDTDDWVTASTGSDL